MTLFTGVSSTPGSRHPRQRPSTGRSVWSLPPPRKVLGPRPGCGQRSGGRRSIEASCRHHEAPPISTERAHRGASHGAGAFWVSGPGVARLFRKWLEVPPSRVYGVATFYHFFSLKPKGKHSCVVCMGTACYVKGAATLVKKVEDYAGIRAGETRADGIR